MANWHMIGHRLFVRKSIGNVFYLRAGIFGIRMQCFIIKPPACWGAHISIDIYQLWLLFSIISPWSKQIAKNGFSQTLVVLYKNGNQNSVLLEYTGQHNRYARIFYGVFMQCEIPIGQHSLRGLKELSDVSESSVRYYHQNSCIIWY